MTRPYKEKRGFAELVGRKKYYKNPLQDISSVAYPCKVELGLYADHLALLFILCAQNLELCWVEGRFRVDGVYDGVQ